MSYLTFIPIALLAAALPALGQQRLTILDSALVSKVWSGHPVDFSLLASPGDSIYAAYYDSAEAMTVAMRPAAAGSAWKYKKLPSQLGWDSHNYVTAALDERNTLHVSGNMHVADLVYFRETAPGDIGSLQKVASMVGTQENSMTYPVFFQGTKNELLYMYRDGGSGNGNEYINRWNPDTKAWTRLLGTALFDGQGLRNAYLGAPNAGPVSGPDGYYHLFWFWRETPDAATTHDVSYMRTKNLTQWETSSGAGLALPINYGTPGVILDSVPQHGGVINRGQIGFDAQGRPIVSYHKFDSSPNGYTQIYNARLEDGKWRVRQTSNWTYKWNFGGNGTLVLEVQFGPVTLNPDGTLTQWFYHYLGANGPVETGVWVLDPATLQPLRTLPDAYWPANHETAQVQGMQVNWAQAQSKADPAVIYALRWETMPNNQDLPRSPIPAATPLMWYKLRNPNAVTALFRSGAHAKRLVNSASHCPLCHYSLTGRNRTVRARQPTSPDP
ncbi:MAG: BNR repeat-containing protein [Fibrobacteres bacterium]|nr:BNR repeat-containing protein [Fibrobacterota bacterium]